MIKFPPCLIISNFMGVEANILNIKTRAFGNLATGFIAGHKVYSCAHEYGKRGNFSSSSV